MAQASFKTLSPVEAVKFSRLYERFAPLVRSLAYNELKDWHGAWDVVHDVFLAVLNGMESGSSPDHTQAWIMAVARNKIVDRVRNVHRRRERERVDEPTSALSLGADEQRQLEHLHAAIANLSENERLTVWLFYLDGVPAARIVELTGVPLRTVYARLAQARRSLRNQMLATRREVCS